MVGNVVTVLGVVGGALPRAGGGDTARLGLSELGPLASSGRLAGAGRASPEDCSLGLGVHRSGAGSVEADCAITRKLATRDEPIRDVCKQCKAAKSIFTMAQPVHKAVTLVCCSSSTASWTQTVARDDVEIVTSTPETLMDKLDASKE